MEIQRTVLVFIFSEPSRLLMIWKKTGQGKGKWNVPGGKCNPLESDLAAAHREAIEETGLIPGELSYAGTLEFYFAEGGSWSNICQVFTTHAYSGELLQDSEECRPTWIAIAEIPWDQMWESDRTWLPLVLQGKLFHRKYFFDKEDRLIREEVV